MKQLNNKIAKQIIQVSGIDLFQNSRRREVVEINIYKNIKRASKYDFLWY